MQTAMPTAMPELRSACTPAHVAARTPRLRSPWSVWMGVFAIVMAGLTLSTAAHAQVYWACFGTNSPGPIVGCGQPDVPSQILALSIGGSNPAQVLAGVLKQGTPSLGSMTISKNRDATSDALIKDA